VGRVERVGLVAGGVGVASGGYAAGGEGRVCSTIVLQEFPCP
jgi:hypothetical protein